MTELLLDVPPVIGRYMAAYNALDVAGMVATMTEDMDFEHWADGQLALRLEGRAALEAQAQAVAGLFVVRSQTVTAAAQAAGGDWELSIRYRATLAADVPGLGAAGETLEMTGHSTFRLRDGLICFLRDEA